MSDNPAAIHAFAAAKLTYISATYAASALLCGVTAVTYALGDLIPALVVGARRADRPAGCRSLLRSGSSAAGSDA